MAIKAMTRSAHDAFYLISHLLCFVCFFATQPHRGFHMWPKHVAGVLKRGMYCAGRTIVIVLCWTDNCNCIVLDGQL